jgi:glycosyltransferase involved in cell wall biosynthesis
MLERLPGFEHERFALSSGRSPASGVVSIPRRWPDLAARIRSAGLVHVHGDVAAALTARALRGRPAVITTHGLHMSRRLRGPARRALARRLNAGVGAGSAVICTSESELEELSRLVDQRDRDKLVLIHNGVDPPAPIGPAERVRLREELGATEETILGLFAGQLEPRKAPLLAARAAARLAGLGVPFRLAVAGDGPQRGELEALRGQAVSPLGHRRDLGALMAAADVFVAPAEREGMSLALLEAMSYGLAIVAADGPGNPEALGDSGLIVPAGDEDALLGALRRLAEDQALRASLSVDAAARAREHFSAERFLSATGAVYERVASLTAPGRGGPSRPV